MPYHPITPVECTPGTASSYQDVDIDSYIAGLGSDVKGVQLLIVSLSSSTNYQISVRKNGATDDRYYHIRKGCQTVVAIGVDSSHIFEAKLANITNIDMYIIGYYSGNEVTFFDNATDKSTSTTDSWQDVDCSAIASGAVGLFFQVTNTSSYSRSFGLRTNGSTDARINEVYYHSNYGAIIGCDSSQICEQYIGNTSVGLWCIGFVSSGATFNTNSPDRSLAVTGAYADLTALPSGAVAGIYEIIDSQAELYQYDFALRKKGTSGDLYYEVYFRTWYVAECDTNRIVQGKIENTYVDFYEIGYFSSASSGAYTLSVGAVSYSLSASSVGLLRAAKIDVGAASCSLSLSDLTLRHGYSMAIGQVAYSVVAQDLGLRAARKLPIGAAAYSMSPQAVGLLAARKLSVGSVGYVLAPALGNLFSDDFESGDFSKWDAAAARWTVQSDIKYAGAYAAKGESGAASGDYLYSVLDSPASVLVMEFLARASDPSKKPHCAFVNLTLQGGMYLRAICPFNGKFTYQDPSYFTGYYNGYFFRPMPTDTSWSADTWYKVKVKIDIPNGLWHFWVDDVYKGNAALIIESGEDPYYEVVDPADKIIDIEMDCDTWNTGCNIFVDDYKVFNETNVLLLKGSILNVGVASYSLSPQVIGLLTGRKLAVGSAAYDLSIADVILKYLAGYFLSIGAVSYSLSAQDIILKAGRKLPVEAVSYSMSPQAVGLHRGARLSIGAADYALSASDVGLLAGRKLAVGVASYSLTIEDIILRYLAGYSLQIGPVSYSMSPQDIGLRADRRISLGQVAHALTFQDLELKAGRRLGVGQAAYALAAEDLGLKAARKLPIGAVTYSFDPQDLGLYAGRKVACEPVAYVLSAEDLGLLKDSKIALGALSYGIAVGAIGLIYSGEEAVVFICRLDASSLRPISRVDASSLKSISRLI